MERLFIADPSDRVILRIGKQQIVFEPSSVPDQPSPAPVAQTPAAPAYRVLAAPSVPVSAVRAAERESYARPVQTAVATSPGSDPAVSAVPRNGILGGFTSVTAFARAKPSLAKPASGKTFVRIDGKVEVIGRVVGEDQEIWTITYQDNLPANIVAKGATWFELPYNPVRPRPGDVVFSGSAAPFVLQAEPLSEAEGGGWAVRTPANQ
ncbi:MAG: hypothetical protein ACHQ5A_07290, partial [Opitutales bacterium]